MRNQTELPLRFTTPATGREQALLVGPGETLTFESRVQGEADGEAVDRGVAETGNRFTPEPDPEPETRARARARTRARNPSPSPSPGREPCA